MGSLVRYLKSRNKDIDLIERAVRGNWPVSEEQRALAVDQVLKLCRSDNESVAVKALRVLQMMMASDRQYEVAILNLVAQDQSQESVFYPDHAQEDPAIRELDLADAASLHQYMLTHSQGTPHAQTVDQDEDEDQDE